MCYTEIEFCERVFFHVKSIHTKLNPVKTLKRHFQELCIFVVTTHILKKIRKKHTLKLLIYKGKAYIEIKKTSSRRLLNLDESDCLKLFLIEDAGGKIQPVVLLCIAFSR